MALNLPANLVPSAVKREDGIDLTDSVLAPLYVACTFAMTSVFEIAMLAPWNYNLNHAPWAAEGVDITIAFVLGMSIDSRNAISTSWENGNTTIQASQNAREAIRDYYARQQIQMLESFSKQMGQAEYTHNVSNQKSGIDDNFLHVGVTGSPDTETSHSTFYDVGMTSLNVSLVNGSSHEIQTAQLGVTMHGNDDWDYHYAVGPFEQWTTLGEMKMQTHPVNSQSGAGYSNLTMNTTRSYLESPAAPMARGW
ncbi:hypothetical protein [Halomontanus rarus]|uniref:hypothetical protein n=1 Tax=Halomontanus rarus TaxID=3034020 RepID=UPI001A989066